jgi:hypothetical protein
MLVAAGGQGPAAPLRQLALATLALPRLGATRAVLLHSGRTLKGTRPIHAALRVVAYDAAANRSMMTVQFTIK